MRSLQAFLLACLLFPASAFAAAPAAANTPSAPSAPSAQDEVARARAYFSDRLLETPDGKRHPFYSELLSGRTVLINFFFSHCKGVCPAVNERLRAAQAALGPRMGKDIAFLSITLDPRNDTRARLAVYSKSNGAGPGWHFLTGAEEDLTEITRRLGETNPDFETHSGTLLIGNAKERRWQKLRPNLTGEAIAERLKMLADGEGRHNVSVR